MNGTVQICKSDVCVKADGDFAKILLLLIGAFLLISAVGYISK